MCILCNLMIINNTYKHDTLIAILVLTLYLIDSYSITIFSNGTILTVLRGPLKNNDNDDNNNDNNNDINHNDNSDHNSNTNSNTNSKANKQLIVAMIIIVIM